MDNRDKLISKQEELIKELRHQPQTANSNNNYILYWENIANLESELSELKKEVTEEKKKYEPYFGWCDVSGCKNEGCSGGLAWRESGYWIVCTKHFASHRNGDPQPRMKQTAIKREKSRDKVTGYLPNKNQ